MPSREPLPPIEQPPGSPPPAEPPPPKKSAAEQSASARIGGVLFRNRSWLPVPFLLVALLVPARPPIWIWLVGAVPILIGEWIRLAGVAAAGTVTRRRSRDVQRLVTYGIFGWVRNPLYVGNFLIWMGFVIISGVWWFLPVAILIFGDRVHADRSIRGRRARVDLRPGVSRLQEDDAALVSAPAEDARARRTRLGRGVAERDQHVHAVRRARHRVRDQATGLVGVRRQGVARNNCI